MESVPLMPPPTRRLTWEDSMREQREMIVVTPSSYEGFLIQYSEEQCRVMAGLPVLWPPCRDAEL
ncbi:hypothetical protein [Verrucomicrobium sp. BvORR106]|uniref:hypothetical protein n=1 Tax=Verrucomicrobium sp. BvORR106 TaxID=1403819 RepID=UPI0005706EC4|nr:hypothetical protein [Verrucomicrobium sp. BvORR106]